MKVLILVCLAVFTGFAQSSPIGEVQEATTVVVEVFADEAVTSATQRARQDGDNENSDEDDAEATTVTLLSAGGINPQPFANVSNFLAEYEYSSQFNLGPKQTVPAPGVAAAVPQAAEQKVVPPNIPPAVPPSPQIVVAAANSTNAEDEDEDAESDEQTEAPSARQQSQQQVEQTQPEVQEINEADNEIITNDEVTTVASEYKQVGESETRQEDEAIDNLVEELPTSSPLTQLVPREYFNKTSDIDDVDTTGILSDGQGRAACECGKLPFRVPIGDESYINLRPWTVAIVLGGLIAGGRPHCAGVLINDRYVLTSARCMQGLHPNGIQVWLTAHSTLENHKSTVGTTKVNVIDIIIHPNYRRDVKDNDICLLKMSQPVDISTSNSYFTPICLPSDPHSEYAGRYGQIFGWGSGRVNRICAAEVPILENGVCQRDTKHNVKITNNMMCAGYLTPGGPVRTDDCIGDAGSPLTVYINGRTSLIGVTSWGFEIASRGHSPTVYTKVSGYADWILHNTEDADWCVA